MTDNTVNKYIDLFRLKKIPDGTIYYVVENDKHYMRNGHNWDEMTNVSLKEGSGPQMSLYTLNQSSVMQFPIKTKDELMTYTPKFNEWADKQHSTHYMLLSQNYHYYTIFEFDPFAQQPANTFGECVSELLQSLNKVYSIDLDKDQNGWEIWACLNKEDKAPEVFYLFPYDEGVVYYG